MNKRTLLGIGATLLLIMLGWAGWRILISFQPIACTAEAKQCSDGSYVGRVPPRCEFAPCQGESGTITGRVSVGPLCPVEPCEADPIDFSSKQAILTGDNNRQIFVNLYTNGTFYPTKVAPGSYRLTRSDCPWLGCASELPKTVTIKKDQTTEVLISIDTGIR